LIPSYVRKASYPDSTVGGGKAGWISEPTLYLWGEILEGLPPSPGRERHRGIFPDRLLGAINTGEFLRIGARSGNVTLETRQSLASSDFRLVFKKHSDTNQGKHGIAF
jgi:hypothetical protein